MFRTTYLGQLGFDKYSQIFIEYIFSSCYYHCQLLQEKCRYEVILLYMINVYKTFINSAHTALLSVESPKNYNNAVNGDQNNRDNKEITTGPNGYKLYLQIRARNGQFHIGIETWKRR